MRLLPAIERHNGYTLLVRAMKYERSQQQLALVLRDRELHSTRSFQHDATDLRYLKCCNGTDQV